MVYPYGHRLRGEVEVRLNEHELTVFIAICLDGNQAVPNLQTRDGIWGKELTRRMDRLRKMGLARVRMVKFAPDQKATKVLRLTSLGAQLAKQAGVNLHPVAASDQAEV